MPVRIEPEPKDVVLQSEHGTVLNNANYEARKHAC